MKFVKYFFVVISALIFHSACQKELNFDVDGFARGSLKSDATGDCLPSTINGIFRKDSVLDNTNFIDIQVDLTNTGTYEIKSDTVNGYSFKGTGTLGVTGLNTVRLYGTGKPIASGTDIFSIRFDTSVCKINVTVIGPGIGVAVFTLGGAPGACSGAIVNGIYTQGTPLDVSNTALITVNVTAIGTYTFGAVSLNGNGIAFTSVGVFTTLGIQAITMNGAGLPLSPGITTITASNNTLTSTCTFNVTVLPSGGSTAAVFTLNGVPGTCSGAISNGTYIAGTVLNATNTVTLNVSVLTAGTYSVTSNAMNGFSFSATGNFTTTGVQTITLSGNGIPTAAGPFNFTATAGISTCTFSITVVAVPPPANQDYIPETAYSNWSDKLIGGSATDTSYIQVSPNTKVINTLTYKIFELKDLGTPSDSFFHRKNGGMYYQLYDDSYGFDGPFNADGLLLDSSLATNSTWNINLGNNTINGTAATGLIIAKIIEKGATATIQGNSYTNIIKVTYTYNYNAGAGNVIYAVEEVWYAKGKGLIYDKINDVPVTTTEVYETTRQQIF